MCTAEDQCLQGVALLSGSLESGSQHGGSFGIHLDRLGRRQFAFAFTFDREGKAENVSRIHLSAQRR